jgi:hypothetical protein
MVLVVPALADCRGLRRATPPGTRDWQRMSPDDETFPAAGSKPHAGSAERGTGCRVKRRNPRYGNDVGRYSLGNTACGTKADFAEGLRILPLMPASLADRLPTAVSANPARILHVPCDFYFC